MADRRKVAEGDGRPMRHSRFTGLLDIDLKGLIAGIVSRPYRASRALTSDLTAVIDEVPRVTLQAEIDALPSDQRLVDRGRVHRYYSPPHHIPSRFQRIARAGG